MPEAHVRLLRNCIRFRAPSPDDNDSNLLLAPTGVNSLGLAVAAHYDTILGEIGEPRTLSVFSGISGILQKIPSGPTFSPTLVCGGVFLFGLGVGWLMGSKRTHYNR